MIYISLMAKCWQKIRSMYRQLLNGEKPTLVLWAFPIVGLLIVALIPFLLTRESISFVNYQNTGQIGDTIGGIAGPIIALLGALLTFLAFWVQFRANKDQTKQFNKQDKDTKIDRFENKFYELLRLHKENVNEISIDGFNEKKIEKRKAFVFMYREFRFTFFVVKDEYLKLKKLKKLNADYDDEKLLKLAYIFFYAGVGVHSEKLNKEMGGSKYSQILYEEINTRLQNIQNQIQSNQNSKQTSKPNRNASKSSSSQVTPNKYTKEKLEIELDGLGKTKLVEVYRPFKGHLSRFGHYYRHLFQTVKFVVSHEKNKLIDEAQALEYLRTLRAQLSDHEQVMVYYNAVCGPGKAWFDNEYLTKYKMIHNMPLPLADFGIKPEEKFAEELEKDENLFEWQKLKS